MSEAAIARNQPASTTAQLYRSLCSRSNALGLFPEQIEPTTGAFMGNFPQAFSHIGVISSGVNLASLAR
jgi:GH15 family glucan-1,4-alpha-glucosidase